MALSRERIADELLKLLAVEDPTPTVAIMLDHGVLRPVLPEIADAAVSRLAELVETERTARIEGAPLRRLAALLPSDPSLAERIAVRLKLSNKARKRLACAVNSDLPENAQSLAYYVGVECAVDRLLLGGRADRAAAIARWHAPRMPVGGGQLIAKGLRQGPEVARILQAIERRWVDAGFPKGEALDLIVAQELAAARAGG